MCVHLSVQFSLYACTLCWCLNFPLGSCVLNYTDGWVAMVPSGQTYNWEFKHGSQISGLSYYGKIFSFKVKCAHETILKISLKKNINQTLILILYLNPLTCWWFLWNVKFGIFMQLLTSSLRPCMHYTV